ncbi:MAG: hypothetical protein HXY50_15380 [Ignavibacteriaceae bacterium]|nr:hypothetical protein [Ignavibacteriaceae bacterium]
MKTYIKTILLFLLTLAIGIGIGFQISEIIVKKQQEQWKEYFQPEGFVKFYEEIIKPDEKQKRLLKPLLLKYHEKISSLVTGGFKQMDSLKDSLRIELKPYLTKEQLHRFDEMMKEHKK